jgi:hypothetical protein
VCVDPSLSSRRDKRLARSIRRRRRRQRIKALVPMARERDQPDVRESFLAKAMLREVPEETTRVAIASAKPSSTPGQIRVARIREQERQLPNYTYA